MLRHSRTINYNILPVENYLSLKKHGVEFLWNENRDMDG